MCPALGRRDQGHESGLADVPADQVLRIRYEDLVAAPMTVLPQIAGFAGLDPANPTWLAELERIRFPNKTLRGRPRSHSEQQAALAHLEPQLTA